MRDRRIAIETGVHLDQRVEILPVRDRCEAQPVHADDLRGHALAHLGLVTRVGQDLEAAVAVQVDEPGRHDPSRGIDGPSRRWRFHAGRDEPDGVPLHEDGRGPAGGSGPVHDRAAPDDDVHDVTHSGPPVLGRWPPASGTPAVPTSERALTPGSYGPLGVPGDRPGNLKRSAGTSAVPRGRPQGARADVVRPLERLAIQAASDTPQVSHALHPWPDGNPGARGGTCPTRRGAASV